VAYISRMSGEKGVKIKCRPYEIKQIHEISSHNLNTSLAEETSFYNFLYYSRGLALLHFPFSSVFRKRLHG
jgi:hypothetical protein